MGIFDRVKDAWETVEDVAGGAAGVVDGTVDLVVDVVQSPFTDDEYGGIWDTITGIGAKRGGQILGSMTDAGMKAGGLARGLTGPETDRFFELSETAYNKFSGALSQGIAIRNKSDRIGTVQIPGGEGTTEAIENAKDLSPGQAAVSALTGQLDDDEHIERVTGSAWGNVTSGVIDAVLRWKADPSVLAGGSAAKARTTYQSATGLRSTAIRTADDVEAAAASRRVDGFLDRIDEIKAAHPEGAPAVIRDELFSQHADGAYISTLLGEVPDRETARLTLDALMGGRESATRLAAEQPAVAHQIRSLVSDASDALRREAGEVTPEVQAIYDELDQLYAIDDRFTMLTENIGALDTVPRAGTTQRVRSGIGRSAFYQNSPLTAPLRKVTNMMPQHWLNLNDRTSDIQIGRILRDASQFIDEETALAQRARYMAATTAGDRQRVAVEIEELVTKSVLDFHAVPKEAVEEILKESRRLREGALGALRGREYDAAGRGSIRVQNVDGSIDDIALPLHVTQQADLLPLVDVRAVERAAKAAKGTGWQHARLATDAGKLLDVPAEVLELFYGLWRPATLLRFGWPQRVLMDEQMRMIAKINSLGEYMGVAGKGWRDAVDRTGSKAMRRGGNMHHAIEAVEARSANRYGPFVHRDVEMPGPYGMPGDREQVVKALNSSAGTFREVLVTNEQSFLSQMRQGTGQWTTIMPSRNAAKAADHLNAWAGALNRQVRQAAFAQRFLAGSDVDDAVRWLETTDEGLAYAREMGWRPHTFRSHAEDVADQVDRYAPSPELRQALLDGDVSNEQLVEMFPDWQTRPPVHGEELAQALGGKDSTIRTAWEKTFAAAWTGLGQMPTDVLSRNPYFDYVYRNEATRLIDLAVDQGTVLDDALRQTIANQARRKALAESKNLLYDLGEKSQFAHMLRFMSPFYMSWQEVLTRWTGLAVKNPAIAARARLVWNAPEKAGLVTNENGAIIDEDGHARDPLTGDLVDRGTDSYITLPFDIPGLPTRGGVKFNKKSFNLVLTGTPGFGPPVQVAANEILKERPDLEQSFRFLLPFGSTQESWKMLVPTAMKSAYAAAAGEEDRSYRNMYGRIASDRYTDFMLGRRDDKPTHEEIKTATDAIYKLRVGASYLLPAAPVYDSPYQQYIDSYRLARERLRDDPEALGVHDDGTAVTADEWFLDTHGDEFFYLTVSFTESKDGVPPTIEGFRARERYQDLIEEYPELGGLIIGAEGAGEFARGVYDYQLSKPVTPGSDTRQRESRPLEEIFDPRLQMPTDPDVRLGWMKYSKFMDLIDNERVRRGLPNLNVKAASDLAEAKRTIISQLGESYPAWWGEFNQQDRLAFERRLTGLRAVVEDPRLSKRPDIQGLRTYMRYRDLMAEALGARESTTLTSSSNQDLALAWSTMTSRIVEENPAFAPLFYRYLERDTLEVR